MFLPLFENRIFHWDMQERDEMSFFLVFLTFDDSLTFENDSDFTWLRSFLSRELERFSIDASNDEDWNGADIASRFKSFSVCDVFNDCAKTSLIKSGWLFSIVSDEVLCLIKCFVFNLHALACGNELGRTAKKLRFLTWYVPPERSSKNSSSSDELIRSSASDDCLESDCWRKENLISFTHFEKIHFQFSSHLIHSSSWRRTFIPQCF